MPRPVSYTHLDVYKRQNPFCAGCHLRFDSFGLAFEGYGPVGDARTKDLAGRPIDASATRCV